MIFESSSTLFEVHSKGMEKFSVGERGIDISNNDDVAPFVEVGQNILDFQFRLEF